MKDFLQISNNGPDILETNYYKSEFAQKGYIFVSYNARCLRLLIPENMEDHINDMASASHVVISRGPHKEFIQKIEMWEIMFEDFSDAPLALFVGREQFDLTPKMDDSQVDFSVWTSQGCKLRTKAYLRQARVPIPCMKSWE